ncbi:hypothetical protein AB0M35_17385 [Micromonospora sp. NPDC051196]|uniref:hypothetical protein n=1 Tax=Micromonospora sp. NPDC051196 TaxID=3155281 RepID=UPI0034274157
MKRFSDARTVAVVTAVAALWLLASLVAGRRQDLLGVAMALLCVLLATIAGVAVAAARQQDAAAPPDPAHPLGPAHAAPSGIDADTLETLGDRDAVRAMRARYRRDGDQ